MVSPSPTPPRDLPTAQKEEPASPGALPGADAEVTDSPHPPGEPSDHELIRGAQAGEEPAFEMLVKRHEGRALRVASSLVANREDARDLAQEAFLRVFRSIERFDFNHEFTTWLYRIVTNLAIDHLRKRRPVSSTTSGEDDEPDRDLVDEGVEQPDAAMERGETATLVRACIDRLAPHFRTAMVLRELEGLPCTEIAKIVGATHVTVRWRLHRGRKLFLDEWERMERAGELGAALGNENDQPSNTQEESS